jgi:hypothetical protein
MFDVDEQRILGEQLGEGARVALDQRRAPADGQLLRRSR